MKFNAQDLKKIANLTLEHLQPACRRALGRHAWSRCQL